MRRPVLLRVARPPGEFGDLLAAAAAEGLRTGWLSWAETPPPAGLEDAARLGVLRAVGVGAGRSVAVKPLRGRPVLDDLLREHFSGCRLVLVAGDDEALAGLPWLEPAAVGWRTRRGAAGWRQWSTRALVAALRRPAGPAGEPGDVGPDRG